MREILFKAKRIDNGEWVEGSLLQTTAVSLKSFIVTSSCYTFDKWDWTECVQVDTDTICQYTGLTDKNGSKIWENDIVEFEDVGEEGYEYKDGFDFTNRARVEFAEARWSLTDFASTNSAVVDEMYNHVEFMDFWQYCKVIGNIFDNADLLGE